LENYVQPDNDTKISTNADTVILCPLILQEGNKYLDKYNRCDVIYLQKKNRGYIALYCFYDDVAAANPEKYMQKIKGMFRYRDGEIENSDILTPEDYFFLPRVKRRRAKIIGAQ
jgi:hypothetical protein